MSSKWRELNKDKIKYFVWKGRSQWYLSGCFCMIKLYVLGIKYSSDDRVFDTNIDNEGVLKTILMATVDTEKSVEK